MNRLLLLIAIIVFQPAASLLAQSTTQLGYSTEIMDWRKSRFERLTKPDGWLSLTGLFWLDEGTSSFGGAETNDIVFPGYDIPARLGNIIVENGKVTVEIVENIEVRHGASLVSREIVFGDKAEQPKILTFRTLSWFILKRGSVIGLRLRDSANPDIGKMQPIDYFPVDDKWKLEARFEPNEDGQTIRIEDVQGITRDMKSPGRLVFEVDGRTYSLEALDGGDELFVIFADETSGEDTYGAGRYLYTDKPASVNLTTVIDFNLAHNPPCAYTEFATCPLPPAQNRLAVRISAGEKYQEMH